MKASLKSGENFKIFWVMMCYFFQLYTERELIFLEISVSFEVIGLKCGVLWPVRAYDNVILKMCLKIDDKIFSSRNYLYFNSRYIRHVILDWETVC